MTALPDTPSQADGGRPDRSRSAFEAVGSRLDRIARDRRRWQIFSSIDVVQAVTEARAIDERLAAGESLPLAGTVVAVEDVRAGSTGTAIDDDLALRLRAAGAVVIGQTVPSGPRDLVGPIGVPRHARHRRADVGASGAATAVAAGLIDVALVTSATAAWHAPAAASDLLAFQPGGSVDPLHGARFGFLVRQVADARRIWAAAVARADARAEARDEANGDARAASSAGAHAAPTAAPDLDPADPDDFAVLDDDDIDDDDDARPLRIGVSVRAAVVRGAAHYRLVNMIDEVAARLSTRGHEVIDYDADARGAAWRELTRKLRRQLRLYTPDALRVTGDPSWPVSPSAGEGEHGQLDWQQAASIGAARRACRELFSEVDVVLTPAGAAPPRVLPLPWPLSGELCWIPGQLPHQAAWWLTGQPAVCAVAGWTPAGTPMMVRLAGAVHLERELLGLAQLVEERLPVPATAPVVGAHRAGKPLAGKSLAARLPQPLFARNRHA